MKLLENPSECITLAKLAVERLPHLKQVINAADYRNWEERLANESTEKYVLKHTPYNLLTACVVSGLGIQYDFQDPGTKKATSLINKLNYYLHCFPGLIVDKSFKGKIGNLDQSNLWSTLSELSIAHYFQQQGVAVSFEERFNNLSTKTTKDVDITLTDANGCKVHLEVYTPSSDSTIDGFFAPDEENHHYAYKVGKKVLAKFGDQGFSGLSGKVIAAVNTVLLDQIQVQKLIGRLSIEKVYEEITAHLPQGVDGLLQFSDDFGPAISLIIEGLYLSKS
ncbi:MAG TPA: hypothetical protein VFE32_21410 [Puia sp.]|jgi:hypothetical protein|nr:hypothetical protein [Puia sp.]